MVCVRFLSSLNINPPHELFVFFGRNAKRVSGQESNSLRVQSAEESKVLPFAVTIQLIVNRIDVQTR
jgi:hypothetical protein